MEILLQADDTNFSVTQAIARIRGGAESKLLKCTATGKPYEINAATQNWQNEEKFADELAIWCRESHAERKYNAIRFGGGFVPLPQKQLPSAKGLTE